MNRNNILPPPYFYNKKAEVKMEKFYLNDKSGKKKKYDYMIKNHPKITLDILNWAKEKNIYGLPFDELSFLKYHNYDSVPKDSYGFKLFKGWSKGYSKRGKYKNITDKFIQDDLEKFKDNISEEDLINQKKSGKLSQIIMNNYIFVNLLDIKYPKNIPYRQKINMFLYNITEIPKCEICKKDSLVRLTHGEFRKTCSEKCRRELESNYKKYVIKVNGEKINVQGYERYVVPKLIEIYGRENLKIGFENDFIEYKMDDKLKKYFPDIFIKSENKIIEVKSTYTLKLDLEKNLIKRDSCIEKGYEFNFYIWDKGKIKII